MRHCKVKDYELFLKTLNHLLAIEKIFSDYKVKFVVHHIGGEIIRRSFFAIGQSVGVKNVFIQLSPINWTSFFGNSVPIRLDNLVKGEKLTDDEHLELQNYLENFKNQKELMHITYYEKSSYITKLIKKIKSKYKTYIRSDYNLFDALNIALKSIIRKYIYKIFYYPSIKRSNELCEKNKYFFFPIQYTRESRLTIYNKEYLHPDCFLDMIKQALPDDYKLLVKDHPHWVGDLPRNVINNIRKMDNVYLLNPDTSTHEIIKRSAAIVTINSDVAYEGILYKKPVVVFGDEYFAGHGFTIDVINIKDSSEAFSKALEIGEISDDQVLKFLNMIFKNSYPGVCWGSLKNDNIENLVNSLLIFCGIKSNN